MMAENLDPSTPPISPIPAKQPFRRVVGVKPKKGDLVGFLYTFWKHDPHPLVLVTSVYNDGRIAGINLHNLTLFDMKNLVLKYCNKNVSYQAIKGRKEIVKGFRTYKWEGIKNMMVLDCGNFLAKLGVVREKKLLSPNEVENLRLQVQQQLKRQINPTADELTPKPASIPGKPATIPGIKTGE